MASRSASQPLETDVPAFSSAPRRLLLVSSVHLPPDKRVPELFAAVVTKPVRNRKFVATVAQLLETNASAPAAAAPEPPADTRTFALRHPLLILAVDDNAVTLKVISMTLTSLGYTPVLADSAAKALQRCQAEPFDVILMDVQMPDMDGLEATRQLRQGGAGPVNQQTTVFALTAGATSDERAACRAAGMNDFIAKPVSRPELIAKLTAAPRRSNP